MITEDRLKEILDEINSDDGHTFDEREQREIITELLRLREERKPTEAIAYITDNTNDNMHRIINSKETSVRKMDEIKACPWCGEKPALSSVGVYCVNAKCHAMNCHYTFESWKSRPIEDKLQRELNEQTKLANAYKRLMLQGDKQKMEFVHLNEKLELELTSLSQNLKEAEKGINSLRKGINSLRSDMKWQSDEEYFRGGAGAIDGVLHILRVHHLIE